VDATPVNTRFPPLELSALDAWICAHPEPKPSRPEAIRRLVEQALTSQAKKQGARRQPGTKLPDWAAERATKQR